MSAALELEGLNANAFASWAAVYDEQENPLLSLEERFLSRMLPDSRGRDVVDVGCGTGRWLAHFAGAGVASLCGLDSSKAMLKAAARKRLSNTRLIHAELPFIPLDSSSKDLAIASFVLSYILNLEVCASQLARVMRAEGDLFISDMHPDTAAALGWRRSFRSAGQTHEFAAQSRAIGAVIDIFAGKGFELRACLEPHFGQMERDLFAARGREDALHQAAGMPPVYLLHLRRVPSGTAVGKGRAKAALVLSGAECALGPGGRVAASVCVSGGVVTSMVSEVASPVASHAHQLDLDGYLLFPGLVNAHDHLEFALFPRLGSRKYSNATEWALDIQANEVETINLHKRVPKEVRLWWGGVRNLLSGVTRVCHHNPLHPALQDAHFPVRVIENFGWEHSLAFGSDISGAFLRTPPGQPFIIHAGEGVDHTAAGEFAVLDAMGAVDARTVLVHGLALDDAGVARLNGRGAALVVCPSSNDFLLGKTLTRELLQRVDRVALGSDSPLTAAGDLLDELRFAQRTCGLDADQLHEMITEGASRILHLEGGEGTLRVDAAADVIAVRQRAGTPAEILCSSSWRDVELVIIGGQVRLASLELFGRLPPPLRQHLTPIAVEDELRWMSGPVLSRLRSAEDVLGVGNVRAGGLRVARAEA
ncbi:MAG TPA: methyltransferase domain-containing protein [Acidisarcina sp.]